ncbi:MAG: hypothetical protein JJT78_06325, partial [Leptospira sp.]|nr:hypothetical protein [Leptospira sp.]
YFPGMSKIVVTGSLNGNLTWEETGNRTKWFNFNLNNSWKNGKWEQEGWKIESENFNATIENNRWKNDFNGKLFDSDFSLESDIQLQFWRSLKPDKSVYYPMGTSGSINGNISEIRVIDWSFFYHKIKSIIEKDVQERKEKLILKDYFTEFKIYRYLLEDMNLDWNIGIENAITSAKGNKLKDWTGKGFIKKGVTRIELVQNKSSNRIEFNTKFATKLPYMDFRLNMKDIPWERNFGKICGIDFTVDSWSQDFRFRGTGADTYNISKSASINGELEWKGIQLQDTEENIKRKIPIPDLDWTKSFNLSLDLSHYGEVSYYRGIELVFDENRYLKGSGSFKNDFNLFSFYGKSDDSALKFNLIEKEKFCK